MMSDRFWGTLITFCIVAAALVALPAEAGTISLSWNPVTHDDLAGYRLYYGTAAGNYTQSVDVGLVTQATLSGLDDCTAYYIATKAVTGDGTESESYSNVVSGWARPELLSTAPTTIGQSSQGQLVINGHNFQAGATLILSNDAITVTSLTLNSCHQLVADITVAASAALGAVDVTVVNADQVFGAAAGMFSVTADASGPAISALQAANVGSSSATITWTTDEASDSQLFFRVVGNAAYQQTAVDQSAVTDHSMVLSGLVPGTEYEYYVRSVDGAGNASTAAGSASFTTQTNGFTYLRLEAESVPLTVPLESGSGADAFSGAWVNLADGTSSGNPNNPAGSWDYGFHLSSSDTWHFWFRMHGSSNVENGWLEAVDGAALDYISTSQNGDWEWVGGRSYTLASGLHTLTLGGNEAGARVDRVLVTNDPGFLPSEQPGADVTPPPSAAGLTATASDGAVQLAWTNPGDSDLARVIVRYRTDGRSPQNPLDGYPLADSMATPGAAGSLNHTGLTNGATYHYGIFVIDDSDNASAPAAVEATPEAQASPPDAVTGLTRTDVMGI
jgi:hypothetical protein